MVSHQAFNLALAGSIPVAFTSTEVVWVIWSFVKGFIMGFVWGMVGLHIFECLMWLFMKWMYWRERRKDR